MLSNPADTHLQMIQCPHLTSYLCVNGGNLSTFIISLRTQVSVVWSVKFLDERFSKKLTATILKATQLACSEQTLRYLVLLRGSKISNCVL